MPLGQATPLKIREAQQEKPRNTRQFLAAGGQPDSLAVALYQPDLEEVLQFLDLPAVLALARRIATGCLHNTPGRSYLYQGLQSIQ